MSLRKDDLQNLVKHVFEIDSYKSKLGDDENIIVLSFTVDSKEPALDLENFIEMGYDFVIDADVTEGETDDGVYKVFVEIERSRHAPEQILEIIDGVEKLTSIEQFRFRYYKSFRSQEATLENLKQAVPQDKESYKVRLEQDHLNNFSNFFSNSFADELSVLDETITFKRIWKDPVTFDIVASGSKQSVYDSIKGPIMLESRDISEVIFFTKYIGNYNITKIGNTYVFENSGHAVALEKK